MALRLAGMFKPLMQTAARGWRSQAARAAIPRGLGPLATDVGFNALGAIMAGASLPEGTGLGTRLGAGLEDLAVSVPIGWAGRLAGFGAGTGVGRLRGRPLSEGAFGTTMGLAGAGAEMTAWNSGLMPRPFANKAIDDYQARMSQEQQQQRAYERERIRMQTIRELGGAGLLLAPFHEFSPLQGAML